ncbi:sensor domain-containing diguanylate cyclase [Achromobacter sp. MFA1 R4]|uniref:GGDEF domain-containing protein n=1 Tax=Achromobacter sp. MFA1 R4 TaxID=1881016 RepID=UPI0009538B3B|nr:sensor domain-containing diguanylate cyclase [Achromobacter sp. MFA1 R4]SIT32550.1 PAS domain S-box-containing protein/diguanylate cyclase (GGDEF) domain-containing protein [Achromobacter sp. MFA1 R4]
MPATGDASPSPARVDDADGAQPEADGPLDKLARLARRLFGVDMARVACTDADGVWQAVSGALPSALPSMTADLPWSLECPVRAADGRLLGAFRLLHGKPREVTDEDRQALQDLASLAATAVEKRHALACERADEDTWRDEARKLSLAIAGSGTGVWDRNVVTGEITYSPGWKALLGYSESELSTRIEDAYTRLHPDDLEYVCAAMQDHFDGKTDSYEVEHRIRCKDGSYKWICSRGKVVSRDESGRALRMMGTTTDISAVRAMSERLQRTADLVVNLTDAVPGLVFQCRPVPEGGSWFSYVSAGIWDMFELTADDVRARTTAIEQRIHPEDLPAYLSSLQAAAAAQTPWHLEFRVCLPLQGVRWRQGDASPRRDADNGVIWHGFVTDITDRKRAELELRELAATDALTTLPNRRHFMTRIAAELARLKGHGGPGSAVLMCDLDHFKHINDTWGHAIGDGVLQHFAAMLRTQLREIDLVGRIGGEEFAVVLPDTDIERAHVFARNVQRRIADTPYSSGGRHIPLTVSIGISALHTKDDDAELALSRSDRALYYAKQRGRNRIESVFFR